MREEASVDLLRRVSVGVWEERRDLERMRRDRGGRRSKEGEERYCEGESEG